MEKLRPAIHAARVKLNSCSELSQTGRDDEARAIALEVRKTIDSSLLLDAEKLASAGDISGLLPATQALQDVRVLQCAALLAQALAVQNVPEQASSAAQAEAGSLYSEAKEVAMSFLPLIHPMVGLTRSLCRECGVSASSGPVKLPPLSPKKKEPRSPTNSNPSPSSNQQLPKTFARPAAAAEELDGSRPNSRCASREGTASLGAFDKAMERAVSMETEVEVIELAAEPKDRSLMQSSKGSSLNADAHLDDGLDHDDYDDHHDEDHVPRPPRNIFAEYITDYQLSIDMTKPWFACKEIEMRKRVEETARFVRLQNKGKDVYELADPKFTACGHKIHTKHLAKLNQSRSEPALMQSVKMAGVASPEAFMTSKLRLQLDPKAKPMTMPKRKKRLDME